MPSPLRPIGFDIPSTQPVAPQVAQQLPQPDSAPLQLLSQASQRLDQTLQFDTQAAQQSAQAVQGMAQASVNATQAIAQTSMQEAQAKSQRAANFAQTVSNVGETVMRVTAQYAERQAKQDEAMRKQRYDVNKAQATRAVEDLRVDWIERGRIEREGTTAMRDAIAETIGQYELEPDVIAELTQRAYSPALEFAKQTADNRQQAIKAADEQRRRVTNAQLQQKLNVALAGLEAKGNVDPSMINVNLRFIQREMQNVMSDESVPIGDRLFAVANAMEATNERMLARNVRSIEFNDMVLQTRELRNLEAQLIPKVRSGEMSNSDYVNQIKIAAMERGLMTFEVTDPAADLKTTREILTTSDAIKDAQQEQFLEGVSTIEVNQSTVSALVTEYELSPSSWGSARNSRELDYDRNAKEAVRIKTEWDEFKQKTVPQFSADYQRKVSERKDLQSSFDVWYTEASRSARQNQRAAAAPSKILEQLRGFAPEVAEQVGGKPLTQQDVENVYNAYARRAQAIDEELAVAQGNYNNRYQYFRQYGLSLDVNQVRAANSKQKKFLNEHRQRLEQLRLQKMQAPTYDGSDPNFKGAALSRKPLARGSYGGAKITFPFPANVVASLPNVSEGQRYGAYRTATRNHQGLDFGVPSGTPALSIVSGRVIDVTGNTDGYGYTVEVLGDDGYRYFYAHNSKILARKGQRVNPGDTVALTGNTQGRGGLSTGPHLHLEVRDPNKRLVNPLEHLASRDFTRPPGVRTAGSSRPAAAAPVIPADAIPLGANKFLFNGRVITLRHPNQIPNLKQSPANYNTAVPVRNSYAGGKSGDNSLDANHGYAILANDRTFARKLNGIAKRHGIQAEWLADVIAHETDNTFDPAIPNYGGSGHYGLIQFGPDALKDLGVTQEQLVRMPRTQQLDLVDRYLTLQKRYANLSNIRTPAELAALVFMGGQGAADLRRTGRIGGELAEYLRQLGRFGGRQYDSSANRRNRVSSVIHDRPAVACSMCAAMANAQAFYPHEAQRLSEYIA